MLIFQVTSVADNAELAAKIATVYNESHLKIASNSWFVADDGVTTREVSEKLGVTKGGISGVVVVKVESYFGFAPNNIWEWLKVKVTGT